MSASRHSSDIEEFLKAHETKSLLRFITCGSVDDGKSTLIGRLLFDTKQLFEDQITTLETDSGRFGTTGCGQLDMALLVDGLEAEREQGITIDVAYVFFATPARKFIVADTPGHEQYTRNMATGASTADAAIVLVDARKGVLPQTRRHSFIVSLLGLRHVILAVNKMDVVGWDPTVFNAIESDYRELAARIGIPDVTCIPISAREGDNVTTRSANMPWYRGPYLLECLETLDVSRDIAGRPFRLPIQWVNRPNSDFRGYAGTIASGVIRSGDPVVVLPSARTSRVDRIVTQDGDLTEAVAGQAVTLTLTDEVDVTRGDVIAAAAFRPEVADQVAAHVLWMGDQPMLPGRPYLVQSATKLVGAQVMDLKYRIDVDSQSHIAAKHLELNEIGVCNLAFDQPLVIEPYSDDHTLGAFIIIDRFTNGTVGCGMIQFPLRRASNIHWQMLKVSKADRAAIKLQRPCVLWFTGLSGSGKSTVADIVEQHLHAMGRHTMLLDGDNVRHGLNRDLGFTDEDRVENIRRIAEVAKLMVYSGLIVLVSFISPFRSERRMARELLSEGEFIEIFVDAPLEVCERRDPKGLYRKARAGQLPHFTGIDSPYEAPDAPEIHLQADQDSPDHMAQVIVETLKRQGNI